MNQRKKQMFYRVLIIIATLILGALAVFFTFKFLYPFILAILIVILINPIVDFLQNKARFPRALAILTTLILFLLLFFGIVTLLIAELISGAAFLASTVPDKVDKMITATQNFFTQHILPFYEGIAMKFNALDGSKQDTIMQSIQEASAKFSGSITGFLQAFFTKLPSLVSWIPSAATALVFALLATFFISKDWENLSHTFTKKLPNAFKTRSFSVLKNLRKALFGFIKAQLILMSLTAVLIFVGMLILGVDHALTIALIIGFVDMLPYLGTGIVLVPWAIYEFISGSIGMGIGISILYALATMQRQFMEPKVLSSNLGMNPLATLVALFVGFKVFGFLGLILGPVILVVITSLYRTGVFKDLINYVKTGNFS